MFFIPRRFVLLTQIVVLMVVFTVSVNFLFYDRSVPSAATTAPLKNAEKAESMPKVQDVKAVKPKELEKAAFVALVRNTDLFGMRKTIREIEDRFNRDYHYPYIFLNDVPFTDEFKDGVRELVSSDVQFGLVEGDAWNYPDWIDQEEARRRRNTADYMHAKSESYRFMCRFQSGFVFRHHLLKDLEYYWRIEPDVNYFCDFQYDPFKFMKENNKIYGFIMAPEEYMATVPTLWNTTVQFMEQNPSMVPQRNLLNYVKNKEGTYNGCHFWSNFEIVKLDFYRSKEYMDYFNFLDKSGGFFYERWGDAPVHTIAVAMFLEKSQVHYFSDVGYYHPAMGYCPEKSDVKSKCICDPKKYRGSSHKCIRDWIALDQN
ncbi:putative mannosyltransferase KTR3 [Smittium culicis]|uniref:Putative mannosyltransferase KTR3 n=1 Tax=Smittium culicis TaxID=133412 RepID=A0A1R1Y6H8_9FUNG|nr:putative mannosyltransferase KTR3 [Smittium culicis]OMJ22415.1 putative mannosyltransferase KTR3 [Smittium culicis]